MGRARTATRGLIDEQERLVQAARAAAGALVTGSSGLGSLSSPNSSSAGGGGRAPGELTPERSAGGQINIPEGYLFDAAGYNAAINNNRTGISVNPAQFLYRPGGLTPGPFVGGPTTGFQNPNAPAQARPSAAPPPVAVRYEVRLPDGSNLYADSSAQAEQFMDELNRSFRQFGAERTVIMARVPVAELTAIAQQMRELSLVVDELRRAGRATRPAHARRQRSRAHARRDAPRRPPTRRDRTWMTTDCKSCAPSASYTPPRPMAPGPAANQMPPRLWPLRAPMARAWPPLR